MKLRILMTVLFMVLMGFCIVAFSQEDVERVEDSAFEAKMRPAVPFAHEEHNELAEIEECNECHHVYEDGKLVEDESSEDSECSECHNPEEDAYPIDLVKAYHLNCKGCHLQKKKGPIQCAECHPRN